VWGCESDRRYASLILTVGWAAVGNYQPLSCCGERRRMGFLPGLSQSLPASFGQSRLVNVWKHAGWPSEHSSWESRDASGPNSSENWLLQILAKDIFCSLSSLLPGPAYSRGVKYHTSWPSRVRTDARLMRMGPGWGGVVCVGKLECIKVLPL
jgi:hypothetical protein